MEHNIPLISVAMATCNGEKYLKKQLDSIYAQTYKNIEIVVTDDYSTDSTVDILKEYKEKYGLQYVVNDQNLGFVKNFEKAISLCSGEYIALSDQDDIWEANKIEVLMNKIGTFDLIHSASSLIDDNSNLISPLWIKEDNFKYSFEKLVFSNTITGCTILFKRELLNDFSPIPSGEKYHDWWLALLASRNNSIIYEPTPLVQYRQHTAQDTGATVDTFYTKMKRYFKNIFCKRRSKRYNRANQQILRLRSLLNEKSSIFSDSQKEIIHDCIVYHEDYINHFFHLRTFFIGLKYKNIYFNNWFFYKNILRDLIG